MNEFTEMTKLQFRYRRLPAKDKAELLDSLKKVLDRGNKIMFAYVHGSFVERDSFRDLDVAIWINDRSKAFHYTVDFFQNWARDWNLSRHPSPERSSIALQIPCVHKGRTSPLQGRGFAIEGSGRDYQTIYGPQNDGQVYIKVS